MRYLQVGLGNIGHKRLIALGERCVGSVDPQIPDATYARIEDCKEPYDAVILSVPNAPKYALMRHFLTRGKHVLVEKPLLLGPGHFSTLQRAAEDHGAIWCTGYNHRFEPQILALRDLLPELGVLYHARLFYGNGTAANGHELPAAQELGCHLIDLVGWLFAYQGGFKVRQDQREADVADIARITSENGTFTLDVTYLSWKNTFTIDVYGQHGSLHLNGLCKWGASELRHYKRSHPSGPPSEALTVTTGPDSTWHAELQTFEQLIAEGRSSYSNDCWIARWLR